MELINQIRSKVADYIAGMDLRAFRAWFAPIFLDIEKSDDRAAIQLCYAIERQFDDFSEQLISEAELHEALTAILQHDGFQASSSALPTGALVYVSVSSVQSQASLLPQNSPPTSSGDVVNVLTFAN